MSISSSQEDRSEAQLNLNHKYTEQNSEPVWIFYIRNPFHSVYYILYYLYILTGVDWVRVVYLCGCRCASSCRTSGETACHSTDRDMAWKCRNRLANIMDPPRPGEYKGSYRAAIEIIDKYVWTWCHCVSEGGSTGWNFAWNISRTPCTQTASLHCEWLWRDKMLENPNILPPYCPSDLCWFRLISWPKVLLHSSQAKGLETVMRPTFSTFSKMVLLKNILILVSKLSCFHCDFSARELLQKQTFRVWLKLYLQQF